MEKVNFVTLFLLSSYFFRTVRDIALQNRPGFFFSTLCSLGGGILQPYACSIPAWHFQRLWSYDLMALYKSAYYYYYYYDPICRFFRQRLHGTSTVVVGSTTVLLAVCHTERLLSYNAARFVARIRLIAAAETSICLSAQFCYTFRPTSGPGDI